MTNASKPSNVLILVDFQEGFLRAETACLRRPVAELVHNPFFDLVIATRFLNMDGSLWQTAIHWNGLLSLQEQALAVSLPAHAQIVDKHSYGLPRADFDRLFPVLCNARVFLAGIESDVCVAVIAASLFDAGIAPFILSEYIGSNRGQKHEIHTLDTLGRIVGRDQLIANFNAFLAIHAR